MTQPPPELLQALDLYRRGDLAGARGAVEAALRVAPDRVELHGFAGLVMAQSGDPEAAIPHFRHVLAAAPGDTAARLDLAAALLASGRVDEAAELSAEGGGDPRLARMLGYARQQQGRLTEAAAAYEVAITAEPGDWESINNLGNVRIGLGAFEDAVDAFRHAIKLRPDRLEMVMNLSNALALAEQPIERQEAMRAAAAVSPDRPDVQTELGIAESAAGDFAAAERAFRAAIGLYPREAGAYLELAMLLENLNRIEDLAALADEAAAAGIGREADFIRAWALRREGRFAEALPLIEALPETIDPVRRHQLLGEVADRLDDPARAFAAFTRMNDAAREQKPAHPGPTYREAMAADAALLTPEWVASWTEADLPNEPPAPVFLIGFPRSGTTLLDTLLRTVPALHILEERPVVAEVELLLGEKARLAGLDPDEVRSLRTRYFEALAELAPPDPGQIVVDKYPLHMARIALIHRIFPTAKIVFSERHPCDCVLSCFMSSFRLNWAMRSFTDLEETARLYDTLFDSWTRAQALLPLDVHFVRYERMVDDLEGEMRGLIGFLGLSWDASVLDNQAAAARREPVRTASYSQVAEPLYRRAVGRWIRYREQLAPVLPILEPWVERLGYDMR